MQKTMRPAPRREAKEGKSEHKKRGLLMILAVVFGMAPTVGDVGSCGQDPDFLDAPAFFANKAHIDCYQCGECGLTSNLCKSACTGAPAMAFAPGCEPLVHDGEVCLHALANASCDDYAAYQSDLAPTAPSECQFCPVSR